jgi:hypothetical protein
MRWSYRLDTTQLVHVNRFHLRHNIGGREATYWEARYDRNESCCVRRPLREYNALTDHNLCVNRYVSFLKLSYNEARPLVAFRLLHLLALLFAEKRVFATTLFIYPACILSRTGYFVSNSTRRIALLHEAKYAGLLWIDNSPSNNSQYQKRQMHS